MRTASALNSALDSRRARGVDTAGILSLGSAVYTKHDTPGFDADVRKFLQVESGLTPFSRSVRQEVRNSWRSLMEGIDALLQPTLPFVATLHNQESITWGDGTEELILERVLRGIAASKLSGNPALSVPASLISEHLPIAFQVIGRSFSDRFVLRLSGIIEQRVHSANLP